MDLKAIFYLGLACAGMLLALKSPLWGAIACIEAYMFNPTVLSMNDGHFRYQFYINIAFMIGWLVHWPKGVDKAGHEGWVLKGLCVFIAVGYTSALWAVADPQETLDYIYELFKTVFFSVLLVRVIRSQRDLSFVMMAMLIGVLHASFMHVFGTRWGYVAPMYGRDMGVLPDLQMPVMVTFAPLLIVLAVLGQKYERILSWLTLPVLLDSVVSSYERAGFVALGAELVLILLFLPMRIKLRLAPVIMLGLALFVFRLAPADYWRWMGTIKTPEQEGSAALRFDINRASWQMFKDHPFGVGYRNYLDVAGDYLPESALGAGGKRSAHNNYFVIACETGIEGFIPWILAFGCTCWMLRRIRKRADLKNLTRMEVYAMGIEIGLYGWMVTGWFHDTQEVDPAYWFVALAVVLTRLRAQQIDNAPMDEAPPAELSGRDFTTEQSEVGA